MYKQFKRNVMYLLIIWTGMVVFPVLSHSSWTAWKGVDGWVGLDYRLQSKRTASGEWRFKIQFRNRYSQDLHFNVNIKNGRGSNRVTVKDNSKRKFSMYYTKDNFLLFSVDKVRIGEDNKLAPYAKPDQY